MRRGELDNRISDIWKKTDGGRTIFENILGAIPYSNINSPLRDDDNNASFQVFETEDGKYCYKDWGGEQHKGNAINFVMTLKGISFWEAIKWIEENIQEQTIIEHKPIIKKEKLYPEFTPCKFEERHHKYFNSYELTEDYLASKNVFATKLYAINKMAIRVPDENICFVYYAPDVDSFKLLTLGPNVPKKDKWRNFVDGKYLWYAHEYKGITCKDLFVCKSVKDALVINLLGYCSIALQSENVDIIVANKEKIETICKYPLLTLGTDSQGKSTSLEANRILNWDYFNTKNYLLAQDINDPAELVKHYSNGILNTEIKKKLKKRENECKK